MSFFWEFPAMAGLSRFVYRRVARIAGLHYNARAFP